MKVVLRYAHCDPIDKKEWILFHILYQGQEQNHCRNSIVIRLLVGSCPIWKPFQDQLVLTISIVAHVLLSWFYFLSFSFSLFQWIFHYKFLVCRTMLCSFFSWPTGKLDGGKAYPIQSMIVVLFIHGVFVVYMFWWPTPIIPWTDLFCN